MTGPAMCGAVGFGRSFRLLAGIGGMLGGVAGCAPPLILQTPKQARIAADPQASMAAAATDSITVQVRYYSHSPRVSVVAWRDANPEYGLRTQIRHEGSWVPEHSIYVSGHFQPVMPRAPRATIPSMPLQAHNAYRDADACRFGACSPEQIMGARIEDQTLRAARDSIPVRFYEGAATHRSRPGVAGDGPQPGLREFTVTLHPALIAAYLATVDSVRRELGRRD